jgi:hypothetical protein
MRPRLSLVEWVDRAYMREKSFKVIWYLTQIYFLHRQCRKVARLYVLRATLLQMCHLLATHRQIWNRGSEDIANLLANFFQESNSPEAINNFANTVTAEGRG